MALVTMIPRVAPILLLSGKTFPKPFLMWLKYVPVAVLSAVLAPEIFLNDGQMDFSWANKGFWMACPTFAVAYFSQNLVFTILFGMGGLAFLRFFF